ncbi:MAG TPA: polysaccharide biosynthesis C-terminal domain-containing protein [Steroidobacteraceae bacterium]|nr:polysaccharide biosynthesis C-terminal domain-containing protein [Steroidobacteraceae bacterium]HRX89310.1 polysaccharide biosynthesis C-terminal domain-containing protein [Steroidobacteraceae bacterium]
MSRGIVGLVRSAMLGNVLGSALVRRAGSVAVVSAAGTALAFLMQLALARALGVVSYGTYSIAIAWVAIALIPSKLGFDTSTVKFVAEYSADRDFVKADAVLSFARRTALIIGLVAGLTLGMWLYVKQATVGPGVALTVALLLPLGAYSEISAAALRGLNQVAQALTGDSVIRPLAVLLLLPLLYVLSPSVGATSALLLYGVGTLCSILWLRRCLAMHGLQTTTSYGDPVIRANWIRTSLPLMFANGFLVLMYSLDTVMIGLLRAPEDAGLYSVCSRLAIVVLFAMNAAQFAAAPMFAKAGREQTRADMLALVRSFNLVAAAIAAPTALAVFILASTLLGLFGHEYQVGANVLRVLVAMQLINVLTGPVGTLLGMLGLQRSLAYLIAGGLLINFLLNLYFIPLYGAAGAAWSSLIAHTTWNVAGAWTIRRRLGVDCTVLSILPVPGARPLP